MKYLFYQGWGNLVAEIQADEGSCGIPSTMRLNGVNYEKRRDDGIPSTMRLNGVNYEKRRDDSGLFPNTVIYDSVYEPRVVNECAPSPEPMTYVKPSNPFKGLKYHIGNAAEFWMKECHNWRDAFERLESDVERLRNDKIVANGLIANLEGLAAADGEKIRDLESKLETVAASRERSIDDYNKSVAREGRLRKEIQRINLRLADAEHERVRLRKQLDGQREIAGVENGQLRRELAAAHDLLCKLNAASMPPVVISKSDYGAVEVDAALKERDQWRAEAQGLRKVVDERNKALDAAVKRADGLLVNLRSVKQMVAGIE